MADDESANASIAAQLHSETNTPVPGAAPLGVDMSKVIPAVRNAFTLGWSLVELSGRILAELGEAEQRGIPELLWFTHRSLPPVTLIKRFMRPKQKCLATCSPRPGTPIIRTSAF
jgi:hypothetical protein